MRYFILSLLWACSAFANIDEILNRNGDINIGIMVQDVDSGEVIYQKHPTRTFVPASTTKLFTSYAAMHYLGSDYKFSTSLYVEKKNLTKDILQSNVGIKFSGDPSLKFEDLLSILHSLKDLGITQINGDFIVDNSIFPKHDDIDGGFPSKDTMFCYATPNSAIVVDNNCAAASIAPSRIGQQAELTIKNPIVSIDNDLITGKGEDCIAESVYLGENKFKIYGCIPANSENIPLNYALPDKAKMIKDYLRLALKQSNIVLNGEIIIDKVKGEVVYTHYSPELKNLLVKVLHDSNNLYANNIFRTIGAKYSNGHATMASGVRAINHLVASKNIANKLELELHDGAGESIYNLISPAAMSKLLQVIYREQPELVKLLPLFGRDGTLQKWQINKKLDFDLFAKTGGMKHISTIAGYYLPSHGKKLTFTIMTNGFAVERAKIKTIMQDTLRAIIEKQS